MLFELLECTRGFSGGNPITHLVQRHSAEVDALCRRILLRDKACELSCFSIYILSPRREKSITNPMPNLQASELKQGLDVRYIAWTDRDRGARVSDKSISSLKIGVSTPVASPHSPLQSL
jgi:hypothetical protein